MTEIVATFGVDGRINSVNPVTGEVLDLSSPTDDLARLIADIRVIESELKEVKAVVGREILNRMDKLARWTLNMENVEVTGESPAAGVEKEWDGAGLYAALFEAGEGIPSRQIDPDAINAAVEIQHVYKVKQAGINALRKAGWGELIDRFCTEVPRERRIKKVMVR